VPAASGSRTVVKLFQFVNQNLFGCFLFRGKQRFLFGSCCPLRAPYRLRRFGAACFASGRTEVQAKLTDFLRTFRTWSKPGTETRESRACDTARVLLESASLRVSRLGARDFRLAADSETQLSRIRISVKTIVGAASHFFLAFPRSCRCPQGG